MHNCFRINCNSWLSTLLYLSDCKNTVMNLVHYCNIHYLLMKVIFCQVQSNLLKPPMSSAVISFHDWIYTQNSEVNFSAFIELFCEDFFSLIRRNYSYFVQMQKNITSEFCVYKGPHWAFYHLSDSNCMVEYIFQIFTDVRYSSLSCHKCTTK